jgi:hypothetical protein
LAQQIAAIKQGLGYGQYLTQTQGKAGSDQGWGTSPYAVETGAESAATASKNRESADGGDTATTDFDPLYAPEDTAHGSQDQRVSGKMDFTAPPQKVEEIRSAPEDQKALREYQAIIGAYAEGEEGAMQLEQIPLEYQELVKQYFDELQEKEQEGKDEGEGSGSEGQDK